jgi:hypothetical protein
VSVLRPLVPPVDAIQMLVVKLQYFVSILASECFEVLKLRRSMITKYSRENNKSIPIIIKRKVLETIHVACF